MISRFPKPVKAAIAAIPGATVVSGKRHYKVMSATGRLLAVIPHGRFSEWLTMRDLFRHRTGKPGATPKRRGAV